MATKHEEERIAYDEAWTKRNRVLATRKRFKSSGKTLMSYDAIDEAKADVAWEKWRIVNEDDVPEADRKTKLTPLQQAEKRLQFLLDQQATEGDRNAKIIAAHPPQPTVDNSERIKKAHEQSLDRTSKQLAKYQDELTLDREEQKIFDVWQDELDARVKKAIAAMDAAGFQPKAKSNARAKAWTLLMVSKGETSGLPEEWLRIYGIEPWTDKHCPLCKVSQGTSFSFNELLVQLPIALQNVTKQLEKLRGIHETREPLPGLPSLTHEEISTLVNEEMAKERRLEGKHALKNDATRAAKWNDHRAHALSQIKRGFARVLPDIYLKIWAPSLYVERMIAKGTPVPDWMMKRFGSSDLKPKQGDE